MWLCINFHALFHSRRFLTSNSFQSHCRKTDWYLQREIDTKGPQDPRSSEALEAFRGALHQGDYPAMRTMLQHKAVNFDDLFEYELGTIMWEAAAQNDGAALAYLLQTIDSSRAWDFALLTAFRHENTNAMQLLLKQGSSIRYLDDTQRPRAVWYAARDCNRDLVAILIRRCQEQDLRSALEFAIYHNDQAAVEILQQSLKQSVGDRLETLERNLMKLNI